MSSAAASRSVDMPGCMAFVASITLLLVSIRLLPMYDREAFLPCDFLYNRAFSILRSSYQTAEQFISGNCNYRIAKNMI